MNRHLLFPIALLVACSFFSGCVETDSKMVSDQSANSIVSEVIKMEIARIYICHYHISRPCLEYAVDLKIGKLWSYNGLESGQFTLRDHTLKNEGFDFIKDLDKEEISTFLLQANKLGFAEWGESYIKSDMEGGHQWSIEITFGDGSIKQISGSNKYPDQWKEINTALKNLTGESLLVIETGN